jgi:hypothetical protein
LVTVQNEKGISMSSLTVFKQDGIELVIDTMTGEAFATQAGYCRMSGVEKTALANRLSRGFQGVHKNDLKVAEILTDGGLQGVHLISANTVFKWLMKDNPELAEKMGEAGATVYMHQLAGYKVESKPVEQATKSDLRTEIEAECSILSICLAPANLRPELVSGLLLNHAASRMPAIAVQVQEAHKILAATTKSELLLTPTTIGEKLGISAVAVNKLLLGMGLQIKNPSKSKGEPAYIPSEDGKKHADNTLATGCKGDATTYQHLKWKESIVKVLSQLINAN